MDSQQLHDRVEHDLSLHSPKSADVGATLDVLRQAAKDFAHIVVDATPGCREQSLSITAIEEACQWAIAAVVRNQH